VSPLPYDVVTFDCYGTLIDWERGIAEAFAALGASLRARVDVDGAVRLYGEIEPAVEAEGYRKYRAVLTETGRRVAARLGLPLPSDRAGFLAESLPYWRPFPDTNRGLRVLFDAGYRLGILSNVDDDLLNWTRRYFLVPFDIIVTAEQVGSYKPAPGHWVEARARIGDRAWLHAAQSYFHDIAPALAQGLPTAWVNRKGESLPGGQRPALEVRNLPELADRLVPDVVPAA
jgi:2-haloacid dehalogenase/putative hydrolase of the HAD superfamily